MRPKLTRSDLHAIGQRSNSPDVRALLREIHRLRSIVLRADQLQRALGEMGGAQGLMLDSLRSELEGEPCVAELVGVRFCGKDPRLRKSATAITLEKHSLSY